MNSMTTNVPLLSISPSADEVREYLKWLAASPFAYHIDDSPEDLTLDLQLLEIVALRWNSDQMWAAFDSNQLWEWYSPSDSYPAPMINPKHMALREVIHNYERMREMLEQTSAMLADMQNRPDDNPREITPQQYDRLCAIVTEFEQLY